MSKLSYSEAMFSDRLILDNFGRLSMLGDNFRTSLLGQNSPDKIEGIR
ncbi:MAG: hypothetical protein GY819_04150 [Planctomycetaceae bacterium]|nr:hypothetical protein [Planctomycetaceae bacterium]MCP4461976.1 hypothetical protein [Planctomycetaceae bacterium]